MNAHKLILTLHEKYRPNGDDDAAAYQDAIGVVFDLITRHAQSIIDTRLGKDVELTVTTRRIAEKETE